MSTIKLEIPGDDAVALNAFAIAFRQMADDRGYIALVEQESVKTNHIALVEKGHVTNTKVSAAPLPGPFYAMSPEGDHAKKVDSNGEILFLIGQGWKEITQSEFINLADPDQNGIDDEQVDKVGPFYWHNPDDDAFGMVDTQEELFAMIHADVAFEIDEARYLELVAEQDGAELDSDNMPYDERIHSKNKTLNSDGTWRTARTPKGQTKEAWENYIKACQAEHKTDPAAVFGGDVPPVPPVVAPDVPPAPPVPPVVTDTPTPPPVAHPGNAPVREFADLMKLITANNQKIKIPQINEVIKKYGIDSLPILSTKPELIGAVYADVETIING